MSHICTYCKLMVDTEKRYPLPNIPEGWDERVIKEGSEMPTHSYFRPDEVTSAAQKSVRRGLVDESIQWFLELFWCNKNKRTNILNRALIMAVEDVGPANPWLLTELITIRKRLYSKNTVWTAPSNDNSARVIANIAARLALSKKSRVNDWAVCSYKNIDEDTLDDLAESKILLSDAMARRENSDVLYYTIAICRTKIRNTLEDRVIKYDSPQAVVWEVFDEYFKGTYYNKVREYFLYEGNWRNKRETVLVFIHLWHLYYNDRLPMEPPSTAANMNPYTDIIKKVLNHENLLGMPDYAVDKHTKKGKSLGRGVKHFMEYGSMLYNEDTEWEELSDYYKNYIA